jgi:hypothetical protein
MTRKKTLVVTATIVLGGLFGGAGVAPAMAAPSGVAQRATSAAAMSAASPAVRATSTSFSSETPAPSRTIQPQGIPVGSIVNFIKTTGPAIWNACVKAVKAGWGAFSKWWNGLAGWIRQSIAWITNASAQSIFQELLNWIRNH